MFYSVNSVTKEHRANVIIRGIDWFSVEADADGWIEWKGGDCPVPDDIRAEVKFYDGSHSVSVAHGFWWGTTERLSGTIIAYRPILDPQSEKATAWDGEGLPPIGSRWISNDDCEVEIVGQYNEMAVYVEIESCETGMAESYNLRPILTDRDRWIAAAERWIEAVPGEVANSANIGMIYDALVSGDLLAPEINQ